MSCHVLKVIRCMGRERQVIWKQAVGCVLHGLETAVEVNDNQDINEAWVKLFPAVSCCGGTSFAVPKVTILPCRLQTHRIISVGKELWDHQDKTLPTFTTVPRSQMPHPHAFWTLPGVEIPQHSWAACSVPDHPFSDVFPNTQSNQCLCLCYQWRGSCSDAQMLQPHWCFHHPDQAPPCCGSSSTASLGWLWREKIHGLAFTEYFNACWASNHCVVLLFLSEQ